MAKIVYTIGEMRGSVGNITYSKNAYGSVVKKKGRPPKFSTTQANLQKSRFKYLSQYWSANLDDSQRLAWDNASINFPHTNSLGVTIYLTGFNLFEEFNGTLLLIGQPIINVPPTPVSVPTPTAVLLTADAGTQTITGEIQPNPVPVGTTYVIFITSPYKQGVSNFQNKLRYGTRTNGWDGSQASVSTQYTAIFGSLIAGMKISASVFAVDNATGIRSGIVQTTTTIANNVQVAMSINPVSGSYIIGELAVGQTSLAQGNVLLYPDAFNITLENVVGTFQVGESLLASGSGADSTIISIP